MVKYSKEHLKDLTEIRDCVPDDLEGRISEYEAQGVVFTIMYHDKPVSICGAIDMWPGVAEIWFLTTHHIDNCKTYFYREVKKLMELTQIEYGLHRMQCTVETSFTQCQKWLIGLGFNIEGVQIMYGPDKKDHYRMAKIWHS